MKLSNFKNADCIRFLEMANKNDSLKIVVIDFQLKAFENRSLDMNSL